MRRLASVLILMGILCFPKGAYSQTLSDYLILQDIGPYKMSQPKELILGVAPVGGPRVGKNAGIVGNSHFADYVDTTYTLRYLGENDYVDPEVTITQHAGGDSDKWLMHEMELGYRDSDMARLGLLQKGAYVELVNNNRVLGLGIGGNSYRWISNNNVIVSIKDADRDFTRPEPEEVMKAYLAKFPSVIPTTFKLNSAHDIDWIKDEMDRRLWLSDKWVALIQPEDADLYHKLDSIVSSMNVFLDYREKYFGINAKNEKLYLLNYLSKKDDASIKAKLTEYKTWWTAHKGDSISL